VASNENGIIALIPAYNEERFIAAVVRGALKHLHVVVIDDGSTDRTAEIAEQAGAEVIRQPVNGGKGAALNTGFDLAVKRNMEAAITLDADGQHDPDEIPLFIEAFRAGKGDLIIGQRSFAEMPAKNQFGNRVGTWLLTQAMGQPVPDNQSGYRLLNQAVMHTCKPSSTRFEAEVEILLRAQMAGFRLAWVPIKTIYNDKVSHFHPLRDSARFLRMTGRIWQARRRGSFD
jgi:glycosyltransferase involved in cell wall biosynthesis